MIEIFKDTKDLRTTVKINASLAFENLMPYIEDAYEKYILPYVGEALMLKIAQEPDGRAFTLVRRALGPLAVALASPELAIALGDSGHTVVRNDKATVASDAKIIKAEESMAERGWRNLESLLELFASDAVTFEEWTESQYYKRQSKWHYFNSAKEFQDLGKVDIAYSRLTFEKLRPAIDRYEMVVCQKLTPVLDTKLKAEMATPGDSILSELLSYVRLLIASGVAAVYSSQKTREQRASPGWVEYQPVFYPLFNDVTNAGNYYAEQQEYWLNMITEFMLRYAVELGLSVVVKDDFNDKEKHMFAT